MRTGRRAARGYHEAPAERLDEIDLLAAWPEKAYAAAFRRSAEAHRPRRVRRGVSAKA